MAGLQDIAPMVAKRWVTRAVFAPIRAAALAASQPAWPPPMTMTSNESAREIMAGLLSWSDESRKNEVGAPVREPILGRNMDCFRLRLAFGGRFVRNNRGGAVSRETGPVMPGQLFH